MNLPALMVNAYLTSGSVMESITVKISVMKTSAVHNISSCAPGSHNCA